MTMQSTLFGVLSKRWLYGVVLSGVAAGISLSGCTAVRYATDKVIPGPRTSEFTLETPPVGLTANGTAPIALVTPVRVPVDGWLHGFSIDVVDSAGRPVPMQVVHHISLRDPAKKDLFAPVMLRVFGAGHETESVRLPTFVGYPLLQRDSLLLMAMLHNPTRESYAGVRVRVRITYTAGRARSPDAVYPFAIHVTDPAGPSEFDLPPGQSEKSWIVRPSVAGNVLGFGGHLHRYGTALRFEDLTTGKVLYRSNAPQDETGNIRRVPRRVFYLSGGTRIQPEHEYRITATYFNPTANTLSGAAMGTIAGLFKPESDSWPRSDRTDPVYQIDLQRQLPAAAGHTHHH